MTVEKIDLIQTVPERNLELGIDQALTLGLITPQEVTTLDEESLKKLIEKRTVERGEKID